MIGFCEKNIKEDQWVITHSFSKMYIKGEFLEGIEEHLYSETERIKWNVREIDETEVSLLAITGTTDN